MATTTTTLKLKDDIVELSFIDTALYKLLDDTFEADVPTRKEVRNDPVYGVGRDLMSLSYNNRSIRFVVMVTATTEQAVEDGVTAISRMIVRAQSSIYLSGGGYGVPNDEDSGVTGAEFSNTGDNGLRLLYKLKSTDNSSVTNELGETSVANSGVLTFRIVSADIKVNNQMASNRKFRIDGANKFFKTCELNLEAEPFALGMARMITSYDADPTGLQVTGLNRFHIAGSSIPGDAPALTRITTQIEGGQSIIIARDAGISILNSTSFPIFTGSGVNDFYCWAQNTTNTTKNYRIKMNSSNQFNWSDDNGATYDPTSVNITKTPYKIPGSNVWVYFHNIGGHTTNDYWSFSDKQNFVAPVGSDDTTEDHYYTDSGAVIGRARVTIPQGCHSRYRVYIDATISTPSLYEVRMNVAFMSYNPGSLAITSNTPMQYDWVKGVNGEAGMDLGLIDLSPRVAPFMAHPNAFSFMEITIYMRPITLISSPNATLTRVFLVPAQDEFGYMHAAWDADYEGREVYCNFDANNPYIAEVSAGYFDTNWDGYASIAGLDYTMVGNVITLIPGVQNTVLFLPMYNTEMNWRKSTFSSGHTGDVTLSIRPRFLYGG